MKLLRIFILNILGLYAITAHAQEVHVSSWRQLLDRIDRGSDTTFVVNFWATWCAPCVAELPNFEKLQQNYSNRPLRVLLVSLDFKSLLESEVRPFVQKKGLKNEVFLLDENDPQQFIDRVSKEWTGALPATLFINRKRNLYRFFEEEFSMEELNKIYLSLK